MPASLSASSRSRPAGPTNGRPARSSWSPGCSPTNMTSARFGPWPNTAWVAFRHRSQARQPLAASRSASSEVVSGTGARGWSPAVSTSRRFWLTGWSTSLPDRLDEVPLAHLRAALDALLLSELVELLAVPVLQRVTRLTAALPGSRRLLAQPPPRARRQVRDRALALRALLGLLDVLLR